MKNVSRFVALSTLVAVFSLFFVSCSLSTAQEMAYMDFISDLVWYAHDEDVDKEEVKETLKEYNDDKFKAMGFQVKDKKAGEKIAKGTDGATLKKRFPAKKTK